MIAMIVAMIAAAAIGVEPQAAGASAGAVDDARRAAATRLLKASNFRERRKATTGESIRAAQADLASECLDRAAAGKSLDDCRATATLPPAAAGRLAAREPRILDEVMAASETVYARNFSAAEMDEIARFFATPVGRKYGRIYPELLRAITLQQQAIAKRYLIEASRAAPRRP